MSANVHYIPNRLDWLARVKEPVLEPDLAIVDPHHHLWDRPGWPYMMPDLLADTNSGHNIVATVFVQCRAFHRADGPVELRPVGETQFVAGVAAMSESGIYGKARICEGIVGHADMTLGGRVETVLEAHVKAGNGRFRGIRHITAWDPFGLGFPSDVPTWGRLLFEGKDFITSNPWVALWPGLLISLTILSINFMGDGLRDALDPRQRQ